MYSPHYTPTKPSVFRHLAAKIANKIFSAKVKRLIFISSIVGLAYPLREPDNLTVEKLNKVFSLVRDPHALELPIYVKSVIWRDCDLRVMAQNGQSICPASLIYGKVSDEDTQKLVRHVVDQTPWWLRYKTVSDMHTDMHRLIRYIQNYDKELAAA